MCSGGGSGRRAEPAPAHVALEWRPESKQLNILTSGPWHQHLKLDESVVQERFVAAGGLPVMARLLLSDQIGASIIDAAAVMAILARGGRAHRVRNVLLPPNALPAMQRCTGVRRQLSSQNAPATTCCAEHCRARGRVCSAPAGP